MSYSRRFSRTVSIPYSGTVSYPASQTGGTVHYSGTAHEVVEVDVHVNTSAFDASVAHCNNSVNGLTASVGAMNTAQCLAIRQNADKISKSIIDGFFSTVRTDLRTQKAELEQAIEAKLLLLRQQAQSLQEKQQHMQDDYARTSARYQKIFNDLNNELSIRIHEVDQPVFKLVGEVDEQSDRMLHTEMIQTAVTMSKESSVLEAQISAAMMKRHALQAMEMAQHFLESKAQTEKTMHETDIDGAGSDTYLIPVCYMKTESENHQVERRCVIPEELSSSCSGLEESLSSRLEEMPLSTSEGAEQLNSYLQLEIAKHIPQNDAHSERVKKLINQMFNQ